MGSVNDGVMRRVELENKSEPMIGPGSDWVLKRLELNGIASLGVMG